MVERNKNLVQQHQPDSDGAEEATGRGSNSPARRDEGPRENDRPAPAVNRGVDTAGVPTQKPVTQPEARKPAASGSNQRPDNRGSVPETAHPAGTPTGQPAAPPSRPKDAPPVDVDAVGEPLPEALGGDDDRDGSHPSARDLMNGPEDGKTDGSPSGESSAKSPEQDDEKGSKPKTSDGESGGPRGAVGESAGGASAGGGLAGTEAGIGAVGAGGGAGAAAGGAAAAEGTGAIVAGGAGLAASWPIVALFVVVVICVLFFVGAVATAEGAAKNRPGGSVAGQPNTTGTGNVTQSGQALIDAFLKQKNITYQTPAAEEDIRAGDVSPHVLQAVLWVAQQPGIGNLAISAASCRSHDSGTLHCPSSGPPGSALDIGSVGTSKPGKINELLCKSALQDGNPYHINELFGITPSCILAGGKQSGSNPDPPNHVHVSTDGGV